AIGRPDPAWPVSQPVARDHNLTHDLAGGEVPHQPLGAGMAKGAVESAADLARYAQRPALGVGNIDALDFVRPLARSHARSRPKSRFKSRFKSRTLPFARQPQQPFTRA